MIPGHQPVSADMVTGDKRLLVVRECCGVKIVTAEELLAELEKE